MPSSLVTVNVEKKDIEAFFNKPFKSPLFISLKREYLFIPPLCHDIIESKFGISFFFSLHENQSDQRAEVIYPRDIMDMYDTFDKYRIIYSDIFYDVKNHDSFKIEDAVDLVDAYKEIKNQKPFEFQAEIDRRFLKE